MERDYPELLEEMHSIVKEVLKGSGVSESGKVAFLVVEGLRKHYGGQQVYVPRATAYLLGEEEEKIYEEYDGSTASLNHLSRKYGKSTMQLRKIIKTVKTHRRDLAQMSMFDSTQKQNQ